MRGKVLIQYIQTIHTIRENIQDFKCKTCSSLEFFTANTKLVDMTVLASKDLTTAKKVTPSGAQPDSRDYYWFKSPMLNQLRLLDPYIQVRNG